MRTAPEDWKREAGRNDRPRRDAARRGLAFPHKWRGNAGCMFARMGAFISLNAAADLRRDGSVAGRRLARFSLDHAREDHAKWIERGGHLP